MCSFANYPNGDRHICQFLPQLLVAMEKKVGKGKWEADARTAELSPEEVLKELLYYCSSVKAFEMDLKDQKRRVLGVQADCSSRSEKAAFLGLWGEHTLKRQVQSTHRRIPIPLENQ